MKFLAALIVLTNIALADAPPGHYRLTPRGWLEVYQPRETRLPSCGRDVVDFIASFDHLEIEIGSAIKVNGSVWTSSQRLPDGRMMAVRDDLLEGYSVGISVRRDGRDADGFLVVVGRRDDGESCGDARGFAGRYAR